jgi:hypothetical protein
VQRRHRRHRVDDLLAVLGELSDRVEPEVLPAEVRDAGDVPINPCSEASQGGAAG